MHEMDYIKVFREDLRLRQTELQNECDTSKDASKVEHEAFARACSEILCESGMLIDEPEFLMIDESGYRLDAICWPEEDQPIVEFLLFIGQVSDELIQSAITNAFEKTVAILKILCKPTGRKSSESVEMVIRRIQKLIPCPESILVRIITDSLITFPTLERKLKNSLKNKLPEQINTDFRFCDIKDLCLSSDGGTQGPSKDFLPTGSGSVRCFMIHEMIDHDVYLAAFPGQVLASIFREHGQRLLQKNVRAFLGI